MRLKDRVAIITGGAQGIGKATTLKFVQEGAKIAIWDINAEKGEAFAQVLQTEGHTVHFFQVNTVDAAAVSATAKAVYEAFGQIDILINNASAINLVPTEEVSMKKFDLMHSINTRGTFMVSKYCIPHLKKSKNPHIMNLSAPLNMDAKWFKGHCAYTMAKYGMSMCVLGMAE